MLSANRLSSMYPFYATITYLTCSLTSSKEPSASSLPHFARNSSPKKGFNGFFSLPNFSFRLLYCCFNVLMNHLRTRTARFSASCSAAGAVNNAGSDTQYAEYSVREVELRMNGGAVNEAMSPLKLEMVCSAC